MTITEFLLARLREDEAGATPGEGWDVSGWDHDVAVQFWDYGEVHIGHKRFLAEVEAKRRIVEWASDGEGEWHWETVLGPLAAVYSDHPDYCDEWRP